MVTDFFEKFDKINLHHMIEPEIFGLAEHSFEFSGVTFDYREENSCDESGCHDEGICRCGVIAGERVTSVNMQRIVSNIYGMTFGAMTKDRLRDVRINDLLGLPGIDVLYYAVDRICRTHKLWHPESWKIEVDNGYYGQEITGVYIMPRKAEEVINDITRIVQMQNVEDIVEALLLLEYGSIHQDLQDCVYEISEVQREDVQFKSTSHLKGVLKRKNSLTHYSTVNYLGIRGIVVPHGNGYKAIDGYHRMNSTDDKTIKVLVARKVC